MNRPSLDGFEKTYQYLCLAHSIILPIPICSTPDYFSYFPGFLGILQQQYPLPIGLFQIQTSPKYLLTSPKLSQLSGNIPVSPAHGQEQKCTATKLDIQVQAEMIGWKLLENS
jgi:hypothetical protein